MWWDTLTVLSTAPRTPSSFVAEPVIIGSAAQSEAGNWSRTAVKTIILRTGPSRKQNLLWYQRNSVPMQTSSTHSSSRVTTQASSLEAWLFSWWLSLLASRWSSTRCNRKPTNEISTCPGEVLKTLFFPFISHHSWMFYSMYECSMNEIRFSGLHKWPRFIILGTEHCCYSSAETHLIFTKWLQQNSWLCWFLLALNPMATNLQNKDFLHFHILAGVWSHDSLTVYFLKNMLNTLFSHQTSVYSYIYIVDLSITKI